MGGCNCSWATETRACSSSMRKVSTAHCRKACCGVSKSKNRYSAALLAENDIPTLNGYMGPVQTTLDKILKEAVLLVKNKELVESAVSTVSGFVKGGKGTANLVRSVRKTIHENSTKVGLRERVQDLEREVALLKENAALHSTGVNEENTETLE